MTEFDYKIPLFDGYELEIEASPSVTTFIFLNPKGRKVKELKWKDSPLSIGPMTAIGKEITKHLEPVGDRKTKVMQSDDFEEILTQVDEFVEEILDAKAAAEEDAAAIDESIILDKIAEGHEYLSETENPLIWIANQIDWYTAGERMNILYAFLAYSSQVILKNPISVIALGEGGSGKTHIEEVAMSLIPKEFILRMKSATEAATYYYAKQDPWFFDGLIVDMGDMGGADDHEEAQKFKNLMKELQSDGYAKRIKQEKGEDGEWTNIEYELNGKPCITYTSVPGHEFDDQEMSRSIMLTPRMDNDLAVSKLKQLRKLKNTPTSKLLEEHDSKIPVIQTMVLALRDKLNDVAIVNPYQTFMEEFLNNSKFFKRDIDKYNGILEVITAINGYNRKPYKNTIFTTKADIIIFLDILSQYHKAIVSNLSPSTENLLTLMLSLAAKLDLYEEGFTVNDFIAVSGSTLSKRSIRAYFSELNASNAMKTVGKEGNSWVYVLTTTDTNLKNIKDKIFLSEYDLKVLKFNYEITSQEDLDSISPYTYPGDIKISTNPPFWNDFLPNEE